MFVCLVPVRFILCLLTLFFIAHAPSVKAADSAVSIGVGDTSLVVSGRTSPGALVTILDGNTIIGSATADAAGVFSKTFPVVTPGIHQLSIYATDAAGRLTDKITQEVNAVEHATTTVSVFLPTTVVIDPSVQLGDIQHIQGSTIPSGTVTITLDGSATFQVTADVNGNWEYNLSTMGLNIGQHALYGIVSDGVGNQSYPTAQYHFTITALPIQGQPPTGGGIGNPGGAAPKPPVITQPSSGATVSNPVLTVKGTAQPGSRIDIFNGSRIIGSVFANTKGEWTIDISLSESLYELKARACFGELCSDFSNTVTIYYQAAQGRGGLYAYLDSYGYKRKANESLVFPLHIRGGQLPYAVTIDWGDGTVDRFSTEQLDVSLSHTYKRAGYYNGRIIVQDKNGERYLLAYATEVVASNAPVYWWWLLLLLLLLLLLYILWRYSRHKRRSREERNDTSVKNTR
jgi:hypothetical protein